MLFRSLTLPDSTVAIDVFEEDHVIVFVLASSGKSVTVSDSSAPSYSVSSVLSSFISVKGLQR